ncbi:MAG: GNAT family N-acetyltransferase [Ruminococcaceae bacterium]|nr:GNAT family N-acetyltransferase [Oscillospiraceae bacterium]
MYKIIKMKKEDIPELIGLWQNQYTKYCDSTVVPNFLSGGEKSIMMYLENQIDNGNAIVSKKGDDIIGYIAWTYFDFHSERSAFCPIIGHAAIEEDRRTIYHELYNYAAQIWVDDNRFNHLLMIYNDDHALKDMLYDIGFGSHVIDAYTNTQRSVSEISSKYKISAAYSDAEMLLELIKESVGFYIGSPIFLKRSVYELNDVIEMIKNDNLFVVWDNNTPIGIMNLSVQTGYNIENLTSPNTGLISKAGAYIKPEYRGMGIGKCLLNEVMKRCAEKNIQYLHVCFETANPFANIFWRKHFRPIILSVRRTVNKDVNIAKKL